MRINNARKCICFRSATRDNHGRFCIYCTRNDVCVKANRARMPNNGDDTIYLLLCNTCPSMDDGVCHEDGCSAKITSFCRMHSFTKKEVEKISKIFHTAYYRFLEK